MNKSSQQQTITNSKNIVSIDGRQYSKVGDMLILNEQKNSKFDLNKPTWVDGKVFYEFDSNVTELNRQRFIEAYQVWESVADLEFIERTNQANYIYVQNDNRNYAIVGMVGGRQILSMISWQSKYIIVHEIGHSLGMWHEHMRSDRDDYVTILNENIKSDEMYNFTLKSTTDHSDYDFLSIMHYTLNSYTINGLPTIRPHAEFEEIAKFAGQRDYISGGDQLEVAAVYGPKPIVFSDANFQAFMVANYDLNGDGNIDTLEAVKIKELTLPGNGTISSLDGIEHFRYLEYLNASNENLIDLPSLPSRLKTIIVSNNQFEQVDFNWRHPPMLELLDLSGNVFDVYDCDELKALENALPEGKVSYSPAANGSDFVCDDTARMTLVNNKPRNDLRSKSPANFFIDVPEGQTNLTFKTERYGDLDGGLMDVYVAYGKEASVTNYQYSSTNEKNDELVTISNPQPGRWYVALIPNERSFENVSLTASYTNAPVIAGLLENGVAITAITGDREEELDFYIDIPANAKDLNITINGGDGDADLYVKAGQKPTKTNFDCRPYRKGNKESCSFQSPTNTRYYIKLVGYSQFSDVTLVAEFKERDVTPGGSVTRSNISGTAGSWQYFTLDIPQGMTQLKIAMSGVSGDADLYVSDAGRPSSSRYVCRPYLDGNDETCELLNPKAGTWFIGVRGYTDFQDITLNADWR
ncbi:MAG: pre-peptidase C-terminal domain-containing protein [Gammaproteobacteria bacterium]|nr:pre-peptidase C-terminal domain-containing protein [Gammaproteobacteria bacterium]